MRVVLICILLIILTSCATTFSPTKTLAEGEGIVVARIHLSGSIPQVKLLTFNKNKSFDWYQFVAQHGVSIAVVSMPAGRHSFHKAVYLQGGELVEPDLTCIGEFDVKEGEVTYVGDVFFKIGDYSEYIVLSSHSYSIGLQDNFELAMNEFHQKYPSLEGKYKVSNSVAAPFTCTK